ncbi:MAG: helix-turn-helix transcriptional regulator [Collinsella sp.]
MPVRKLTSEQRLSRAIDIMEALYAAGENGMTRTELCSRFDITGASLDEILEIVSTLADRESGARIICECHGERVVLTGDAGRVLPLRLSAAEGAVLNHELESLGIEPQTAARIRRALLPEELGYNQRVFDTVAHGSHWQQLSCAIQDGVRCRISYRSMDDARPRERLVDPLRITANGDQTYLIAWDITVDEQRTYRMDKIEGLVLTDDSVVPHTPDVATLHDSLARAQRSAKLLDAARLWQSVWTGPASPRLDRAGRTDWQR